MIEKLAEITQKCGIMLTIRYVVEQSTWYVILHAAKTDSVSGVGATLDEAGNNAMKQLKVDDTN